MRKFLGLMIVAVLSISATATIAQAQTSSTTGGYAYDSSRQSMWSCDTLDDGHTFENQSWNADNDRHIVKDTLSTPGCGGMSWATLQVKFRGCRDQLVDNCGPMRYL